MNFPANSTKAVVCSVFFTEEGIKQAIAVLGLFSERVEHTKAILRYRISDEFEYVRQTSKSKKALLPSFWDRDSKKSISIVHVRCARQNVAICRIRST